MAKDITLLLLLDINWKFVYGIRGFDMCRGKRMMIPYNSYFFCFLSARIASASASISPFVRACVRASVPKPQFHYLHNQELCQFTSDWLLMSATRILIKILAI